MHFNSIREYILEEKFKIIYLDKKIDIVNYTKVEHFDSNKITILYKDGSINVTGNKLVIKRLLKDELVISGLIEKIELR